MKSKSSMLSNEHIAMAFGTPVSTFLWPDSEAINTSLRKTILAKKKIDNGQSRSNVGGWHSDTDMLNWRGDGIGALKQRITTFASDIIRLTSGQTTQPTDAVKLDCWANVSQRGHYNSVHYHPHSIWSGVYYVDGGMPDNSDPCNGRLELLDPRLGIAMLSSKHTMYLGRFLIEPTPGLMLVFPSWLSHMVHPFSGDGERISISFNIKFES
jgi:uncharacterized protein (TIGR02466 family)